MRLSTAICLLIIVFSVACTTAKNKNKPPERKTRPGDSGKNKANTNKNVKKKESDEEEEEEESDEDKEEDVEEEEYEEESDGNEEQEDDEEADSDTDEEEGDERDKDRNGSDDEYNNKEEDSIPYSSSEEFKGDSRVQIQEKGIFYSMEAIKEFLKNPDFDDATEIDDLLKRYNESEYLVQEKMAAKPHAPMSPFYVVEGVNPGTRRKVAQILAHRLKGLYMVNQPRVILGPVLKGETAKRAYYSFSKYMIANRVRLSLFHRPVVIESYWMEHASFIMAKLWNKANKLPKPGSDVYRFPEDLLVPNITFVIFNTPSPRLGQKASKSYMFEQRMLLVYKRFTGAKVHIIRFPESPKQIADKIDLYLHNAGQSYPIPKEFSITVLE